MSVISSDPIVLIGPGSEWLWSAAEFVVVTVTLAGIYSQLRAQRAANAFDQIHQLAKEWTSERLVRARLRVVQGLAGGDQRGLRTGVGLIGDYFEEVASLVRAGHIDLSVAYENFNQALRFWWTAMEDAIRSERGTYGGEVWIHFERLAQTFEGLSVRDEHRMVIDKAYVSRGLADRIEDLTEELRIIVESRTIAVSQEDRILDRSRPARASRPRRSDATA
jgi:hypothetical protein